jgi:hypothetical protein
MKKAAIKRNVQRAPREKPMMEKYFTQGLRVNTDSVGDSVGANCEYQFSANSATKYHAQQQLSKDVHFCNNFWLFSLTLTQYSYSKDQSTC